MSGHRHKSALGHNRKITAPPESHHGKPWWTTPPTVVPLHEHLDYAIEFRARLLGEQPATNTRAHAEWCELMSRVKAWIRAANRLLHSQPVDIDGLRTDEEVIVAADCLIGALIGELHRNGLTIALSTANEIRREAIQRRARQARDRLALAEVSGERFRAEVERSGRS